MVDEKKIVRLIYALAMAALSTRLLKVIDVMPPVEGLLWCVSWLGRLSSTTGSIAVAGMFVAAYAALSMALFSEKTAVRFVAALSFSLVVAFYYSVMKPSHDMLGLVLVLYALAFDHYAVKVAMGGVRGLLYGAQVVFSLTYTISGFWKVYAYIRVLDSSGWAGANPIASALAWVSIETAGRDVLIGQVSEFLLTPIFSHFLWIIVVLLEVSAFFVVWTGRRSALIGAGLCIVGFHVVTALMMAIDNWIAAAVALILLVLGGLSDRSGQLSETREHESREAR